MCMKSTAQQICWACLGVTVLAAAPIASTRAHQPAGRAAAGAVQSFEAPQQVADALVAAADAFDVGALESLFGPAGKDLVLSGEFAQGRQRAREFVAKAREKLKVTVDTKSAARAFLLIGNEDWPFPIPLVKRGTRWTFDASAGRQELLYRRIGANELDALAICRGYAQAQREYALMPREGYEVNQYAQRIISTPGKQDGLAWQLPDGTWAGPIGEANA